MSSRLSRRPSALKTTVLTCRMLVSIPNPRTTIWSRGITREKKSVEGSRRTCRVSLKKTARKPRKRSDTGRLRFRLVLVGQLDENIFEARGERPNFADGDSVLEELLAKVIEVEMLFHKRVNGLTENGGAANARNVPGEAHDACGRGRGDFDADGALRLHVGQFAERIGSAVAHHAAVIHLGHAPAAPRFSHSARRS